MKNKLLLSTLVLAMSGTVVMSSSFGKGYGPGWQKTISTVPGYHSSRTAEKMYDQSNQDLDLDKPEIAPHVNKLGSNPSTYAPSEIENDLNDLVARLRNFRIADPKMFNLYFGSNLKGPHSKVVRKTKNSLLLAANAPVVGK